MTRRLPLIIAWMLFIAAPTAAHAQGLVGGFSDYRSATARAYPGDGGGGGTTTPPTTTPAPAAAVAPATATGTPPPPATTTAADEPGSGREPGGGTGNGTDDNPANGSGVNPDDANGNAPGGAGNRPVSVAPSTATLHNAKGGLPFTGSDVTPVVLIALMLLSAGLFFRVAERRFRGRSAPR